MIDYHHHSASSVDSDAPMRDICEEALRRGVTEIAFTEHVDFIPEEANTGYFQYDDYMEHIAACRREFGDDLAVLAAVEVDYCPDFEDDIARWLSGKQFDFIVGSVHYLRGLGNISEPRAVDYFAGKTEREAYARYFDLVRRSSETGMWDSLGHIDLIKRYGTDHFGAFAPEAFTEMLEPILRTVVANGMALEVNASGLRQGPREPYPGPNTLEMYHSLGGERITIGSDSHTVRHVAIGLDEVLTHAMQAGFEKILTFRDRTATEVAISEIAAGTAAEAMPRA